MVLFSLQLVCLAFSTPATTTTTTSQSTTNTPPTVENNKANLGLSLLSRHGTVYNHDQPIIKSSTINGPVSHPPKPTSPTSSAPAVATERPQDLPLPIDPAAADDGSRRPQSSPRLTRKERSIDLEDTNNVLDFLVEQENSLRRNFGEEEFNSNKDYRKQVPDSLNIQEQPYLSLWPSAANRRREDSASVREAAVSSISSRDKIASSNRVPNRYKEYYYEGTNAGGSDRQQSSQQNDEGLLQANQISWQLKPQVNKRIPGDSGRLSPADTGVRDRQDTDSRYLEAALQAVQTDNKKMMLMRQHRAGRMYDVPQIECPASPDHTERFACPRPDRRGRFRCIDDRSLCDGFYDCPGKEDESPEQCLFYKTTKAHLDILAEALLRWARGR